MTVLRDVCGAFLPDGDRCRGVVLVLGEVGEIIEGECASCGAASGVPTAKANASVRRRRRIDRAGLPERFAHKRFDEDDFNREALSALRHWIDALDPTHPSTGVPAPALWGDAGRGKTHLLVALCRRIIDRDLAVLFYSTRSLLRTLQQFDGEAREVWERAVKADVLALDDLGAQQSTEWRHDQLADLVDERYQRERPILLATNFPPSTWPDMLDARTASRLRGMTFSLELSGPDRRQQTIPLTEGAS